MRLRRKLQDLLWRLDGQMERRMIAYAVSLALLSLAFGPSVFRAVAQVVNGTPQITVQPVAPAPGATSVDLRAETSGGEFQLVDFLVLKEGDTAPLVFPGLKIQPNLWEHRGLPVVPGVTYSVRAKGLVPPSTSNPTAIEVITEAPVAFTVPVAQTGPICGDDVCQPEESTATCAADCGAVNACGDNVCQADETSSSCPVDCPVPPEETGTSAPPPVVPIAKIEFMTPAEGDSFAGPAPLRVRILDGAASSVLFDVVGPAGALPTVQPTFADGTWFAPFTASPGLYAYMARATLLEPSGATISTPTARGFTLIQVSAPPPTGSATTTEGTANETFPSPSVELLSPPEGSGFSGPVPLSAAPRNGEVGSVRFLVKNIDLDKEIIVIANDMGDGRWNAFFEGVPGHYRVVARATFAGPVNIDSRIGAFAVFGQTGATSATTTETTALPPPPPPPPPDETLSTTEPTATLPPPPPPPDGTVTSTPITQPTPPPPPPPQLPPPAPLASATAVPPRIVNATGTTTPADLSRLPSALQQPYAADIPPTLVLECRTAGIVPERCRVWLSTKYRNRTCLEAGATTREACADALRSAGESADERTLIGLATKAEVADVRERVKETFGAPRAIEDLPRGVEAFLTFAPPRRDAGLLMLPSGSDARLGERSAPALTVLDTDADGLPDDLERRLGSDPEDDDTDDDGFADGVEVRNGYDPAGPDRLAAPPRGVEAAILAGAAIEEPRSVATTDDSFAVDEAAPATDDAGGDVVRLSGRAAPNTVVTLFIYSYLPVVVTTTTDADGNWRYDFSSRLAEGRHEAYVAVNDDTGKLVASSSPLAFFVREAQAVTEEDFLRPDVNVEEAPAVHIRAYLIGGGLLVLLALVLTVVIVRQVRRNPIEPPPGGGIV